MKGPWLWSIGIVIFIGLTPVVAAFVGELMALAMGCTVEIPNLRDCARGIPFFESFSLWLMQMIAWAIITVPCAIAVLVGLAISHTIIKKREEA
ncbi:MAG: hypothetical protein AAF590_04600 [Pseudomonadota bacterium]